MADLLLEHPELRPFVLSNVRITGTRIGAGSFARVEKVEIPGAVCAAKKIHDIFQDRSEIPAADIQRATAKFVEECQLMSTLRHPHIVQFLGVCFLPGSRLPALVMELLLTSLHDLLDPETGDSQPTPSADAPKPFFPLGLKRSILHDVARGLAYLHERSPPIIHRDLSARNVLLNSAMVAKIADLGVARVMPRMRAAVTMTKAPGAFIYMPPEALVAKSEDEEYSSKYDVSIDIFSFGVVAIFTLSQTFPCNLQAPNYRENRKLIGRTELERRDQYMQKIYCQLRKGHPLIQMIEGCLDFPEDRPGIRDVLQLLEQARAEVTDEESDLNKLELVQALQSQNLERDFQSRVGEIADLQQQLQSTEKEMETVSQQLGVKEAELTTAEEAIRREQQQNWELRQQRAVEQREKIELQQQNLELRRQEAEKDDLAQAKNRELTQAREGSERLQQQNHELRQQEQSSGRVIGDLERQLKSTESLVADFQKSLEQRDSELEAMTTKMQQAAHLTPPPGKFSTFQPTQQKKPAPRRMERGSAVTHQNFAYFTPRDLNSVYRYTPSEDKWEELPLCPYRNSALVVIDHVLTAVGGDDGNRHTNKVFTLRQSKWVQEYPPMNTARSSPAVVSTSDGRSVNVVAIGGYCRGCIEVVELFNTESGSWSEVTSLPQPLPRPSATICGNELYALGCNDEGYTLSLNALLSSDQPIRSQQSMSRTWTPLPRLPVVGSTAATVCGQLVIVGGKQAWSPVNPIHQLIHGQWVEIGSLSSGRGMCLVASPSPESMVVVGGVGARANLLDSVELCVAVCRLVLTCS